MSAQLVRGFRELQSASKNSTPQTHSRNWFLFSEPRVTQLVFCRIPWQREGVVRVDKLRRSAATTGFTLKPGFVMGHLTAAPRIVGRIEDLYDKGEIVTDVLTVQEVNASGPRLVLEAPFGSPHPSK